MGFEFHIVWLDNSFTALTEAKLLLHMIMKESQTRPGAELVDAIVSDQQCFLNLLLFVDLLSTASMVSAVRQMCLPPVQCPRGSVKPALAVLYSCSSEWVWMWRVDGTSHKKKTASRPELNPEKLEEYFLNASWACVFLSCRLNSGTKKPNYCFKSVMLLMIPTGSSGSLLQIKR